MATPRPRHSPSSCCRLAAERRRESGAEGRGGRLPGEAVRGGASSSRLRPRSCPGLPRVCARRFLTRLAPLRTDGVRRRAVASGRAVCDCHRHDPQRPSNEQTCQRLRQKGVPLRAGSRMSRAYSRADRQIAVRGETDCHGACPSRIAGVRGRHHAPRTGRDAPRGRASRSAEAREPVWRVSNRGRELSDYASLLLREFKIVVVAPHETIGCREFAGI